LLPPLSSSERDRPSKAVYYSLAYRYRVSVLCPFSCLCHSILTVPSLSLLLPALGPSTRVRISVRIAVRFRAQFASKPNVDPILYLTRITMVCLHISRETNQKLTCGTPLAANRTPNRMPIRTQNHTCRRPLQRQQQLPLSLLPLIPNHKASSWKRRRKKKKKKKRKVGSLLNLLIRAICKHTNDGRKEDREGSMKKGRHTCSRIWLDGVVIAEMLTY
jgi:hypothetical protein